MSSTGIVRRIDDLGRIVVPKEFRKTLRILDGDSLSISLNQNNEIVLKKHSTINDIWSFANDYAICLNKFLDKPIIIFDLEKVIITIGKNVDNLQDNKIGRNLELSLRKKNILNEVNALYFNKPNFAFEFILPIMSNGDVLGGICCLSKNSLSVGDENIIKVASSFIGKHLEYVN